MLYCGKFLGQMKFKSIYYFIRSRLLDKSCQICQTKHSYTIWDISGVTRGILLHFKLGWKLDISRLPTIYDKPSNSLKKKRVWYEN
jgi:hypothetical protein